MKICARSAPLLKIHVLFSWEILGRAAVTPPPLLSAKSGVRGGSTTNSSVIFGISIFAILGFGIPGFQIPRIEIPGFQIPIFEIPILESRDLGSRILKSRYFKSRYEIPILKSRDLESRILKSRYLKSRYLESWDLKSRDYRDPRNPNRGILRPESEIKGDHQI